MAGRGQEPYRILTREDRLSLTLAACDDRIEWLRQALYNERLRRRRLKKKLERVRADDGGEP